MWFEKQTCVLIRTKIVRIRTHNTSRYCLSLPLDISTLIIGKYKLIWNNLVKY